MESVGCSLRTQSTLLHAASQEFLRCPKDFFPLHGYRVPNSHSNTIFPEPFQQVMSVLSTRSSGSEAQNCPFHKRLGGQPPSPGKPGEVTGIACCEVLRATAFLCWGQWDGLRLPNAVHSVPAPVPVQLFRVSLTDRELLLKHCLWRHCPSESCK